MIRSAHNLFIPTLKETPADAESLSHQFLLRAGFVRQLSSGLYTFLPLGLKVLRKVENIVREEMDASLAQELMMPLLQPGELWHKSGRWDSMGLEMLRVKNRKGRDYVLGPTHEEVITDLITDEISSYKNLPVHFYQIQTKVRDEIRPRFGMIRAKEFIMKDSYSFHVDEDCLDQTYQEMFDVYHKIFTRCGLKAVAVDADSGVMGGGQSSEFMVLADIGEDLVAFCESCDKGSNIETVRFHRESHKKTSKDIDPLIEVSTPNMRKIDDVCQFFDVAIESTIKSLLYHADDRLICVLISGGDQLNEVKLKSELGVNHLKLVDGKDLLDRGVETVIGFVGPVGLKNIEIIADSRVLDIEDAIVGANVKDRHLQHVSYARGDYEVHKVLDLAMVKDGDICSCCKHGKLVIKSGIEIGHIFKLGDKYTKSFAANYLNENGQKKTMQMGCYGLGVSRTIAAIVEQNNDKNGIIWPLSVAPFDVCIVPIDVKDMVLMEKAREVYESFRQSGYDALLDDRRERAGFKFKDADLIGIPFRIVMSKNLLDKGFLEIKVRRTGETFEVSFAKATEVVLDIMKNLKKSEEGYDHG
ncbi:proline--tRNA ligase [PVC group bacterium (ex Bugula neritina AB1)]|nr:proline--tRNA ligase [PVC group bacterium (ex Bugula neritina AB1)]